MTRDLKGGRRRTGREGFGSRRAGVTRDFPVASWCDTVGPLHSGKGVVQILQFRGRFLSFGTKNGAKHYLTPSKLGKKVRG